MAGCFVDINSEKAKLEMAVRLDDPLKAGENVEHVFKNMSLDYKVYPNVSKVS